MLITHKVLSGKSNLERLLLPDNTTSPNKLTDQQFPSPVPNRRNPAGQAIHQYRSVLDRTRTTGRLFNNR